RVGCQVGGEDFDVPFRKLRSELVRKQQRERISFLACRAACRPDSQAPAVVTATVDQFRNDRRLEEIEGFGIAKESGYLDEKRADQFLHFVGMRSQIVCIVAEIRV